MNAKIQTESGDRRTTTTAAGASVLAHALLLLLCMFFNFGEPDKPAEWIEISFAEGRTVTAPAPRSEPVYERAVEPEATRETTPPAPQPESRTSTVDPVKVNLPERRMLEEDVSELPARSGEKISAEEDAYRREDIPRPSNRELESELPSVGGIGGSTSTQKKGDSSGAPSATSGDGEGFSVPFSIEGDAANRTVLHRVIPEFPEGVRRSAAVRIRFTVLADGQVGSAILVQKGEARLEKVALDAFRQWRFNALPSSAGNRIEQGVITFRFLLK